MDREFCVLFGAIDRHNLGDLLFPHIVAALRPDDDFVFAGLARLARRDLRAWGGHRVEALARLAQPAALIHVGGEILSCGAWPAAVMIQTPAAARRLVARLDADPRRRLAWAHEVLGCRALAPYSASRFKYPQLIRTRYFGVGGADLDCAPADLRAEVLADLACAERIGVRDRATLKHLEAAACEAVLMPDPVALLAELFGARIAAAARVGEVAAVRMAFPQGWLAVQFSAEFGDDATLAALAAALDTLVAATGLGIVLFRAGAAPWHDDSATLRRVAAAMAHRARLFESLDIWDLCALIASSRAFCGSSLHGRIIAMAYALPRLSLLPPQGSAKLAAYVASWEVPGLEGVVAVGELAPALRTALTADPARLREHAGELALRVRQAAVRILG